MTATNALKVMHADRLALRLEPAVWPFAVERRAAIDTLFAELRSKQPALFNGRVLLMHRMKLEDSVLSGGFLEADYASFVAWQRWGHGDVGIYDCFGAAAVQSADGAFLLGQMGAHTFNAGQLYFPCGTPDPSDVRDGGKVDFDFSIRRELREETGLDPELLSAEPGWTLVSDGKLIACIKVMRSSLAAEPLRAQILDALARERQPELADIRVVRSPSDFDPAMRGFVTAFLAHRFAHT